MSFVKHLYDTGQGSVLYWNTHSKLVRSVLFVELTVNQRNFALFSWIESWCLSFVQEEEACAAPDCAWCTLGSQDQQTFCIPKVCALQVLLTVHFAAGIQICRRLAPKRLFSTGALAKVRHSCIQAVAWSPLNTYRVGLGCTIADSWWQLSATAMAIGSHDITLNE